MTTGGRKKFNESLMLAPNTPQSASNQWWDRLSTPSYIRKQNMFKSRSTESIGIINEQPEIKNINKEE